jgi:hypothetical protein
LDGNVVVFSNPERVLVRDPLLGILDAGLYSQFSESLSIKVPLVFEIDPCVYAPIEAWEG